MATFAELVSDVKIITNRPDLDSETKLAVKAATLKAHQFDFFPKDLYEIGISWATPDYIQSVDYRTLIPRWRAFKYLRKYANNMPGKLFTMLTPEQILDRYGYQKDDICYIAGDMLEIRSSTQDSNMIIACYLNPVLTDNNYTSWVAIDHPFAIVYEAARAIFKQIGFDEQAQQMKMEVSEQYQILKQEVVGYGE